ncbi:MAG: AmmeMemoRadiSam system radical SAM enzyme [Candidatus Eisenbacteria bacterium]|nr:AmmeMemoRadiSam system radical SAM enzyme [Candidatus Eisenbacteria bacterium]
MDSAARELLEPGVARAGWWRGAGDGRVECTLCPRHCRLRDGQRGFCFARQARGGGMALTGYGRASGFCVDPIEKKPLHHFLPGTGVLSFGTVGCNLGCSFCQNWDISKARDEERLDDWALPEAVAQAAVDAGCRSVAFTYNEPVIFAEYAMDCAQAAHERGLRTVAVSAGYVEPGARAAFFSRMDAANVDLKAMSPAFYRTMCLGELVPVLDTLRFLANETGVWLEVTNLLIPGHNDAPDAVARLCDWVAHELGPGVPLHFTAFHPDFRMLEVPPTPPATLARARKQARAAGLQHVYTGNLRDPAGQSTWCASCGARLIERDGYHLGAWDLDEEAHCRRCGTRLAGCFDHGPGVPAAPSGR